MIVLDLDVTGIKDRLMNTKDTGINDTQFKKLLHNDNYYKQIFKKTEKIVSVVFYILNNVDADKKSETHISNMASKAHFAHENALRTLEIKPVSSKEVIEQFAQALVGLDSTLRISAVSGVISPEVLAVLTAEIDVVLRGLKTFLHDPATIEGGLLDQFSSQTAPMSAPGRSSARPVNSASRSTQVPAKGGTNTGGTADRRDRIKTILEAKGEASIKDISEIITDCSEKTIQRELNAMIQENLVKRQGERRWSKYSIF